MAYNPSNTFFYQFWKFLYGDNDPRVATGLDWNQDAKDGFLAILANLMSLAPFNPASAYTAFQTGCIGSDGNRYLCLAAPSIAASTVTSITLATGVYTVHVASGTSFVNGMAIQASDGTNTIAGVIASGGGTNALVLASGTVVAGTPASMAGGTAVNARWAPPNTAYWQLVGPVPAAQSGLTWLGAWNSATAYVPGNLVLSGGVLYVCLSANTNSEPPNATYWQVLAMTVVNDTINWRGAWSSAASYAINDAVSDGGNAYIAVAANTNSEPPNGNWNLLASKGAAGGTGATGAPGAPGADGTDGAPGLNWRGPWSSTNSYAIADGVSYGGNSYIAVAANINDAPPSANWNLLCAAGGGNVTGPVSPTTGDLASFSAPGVLADSGVPAASVVLTGDARLSDARTPTAHAASHAAAGSDPVSPASIGAIPALAAGAASGVAQLDSGSKVPLSQLPSTVVGALEYQGAFDCSGGSYPSSPSKGQYWVCSVAGTISGTAYVAGDWLIYNGSAWERLEGNPSPVTSVAGKTGTVTLGPSDVGADAAGAAAAAQSAAEAASAPATHASQHKNGGSDEVATATPAANAIPKAGSGGTLAFGWIPNTRWQPLVPGTDFTAVPASTSTLTMLVDWTATIQPGDIIKSNLGYHRVKAITSSLMTVTGLSLGSSALTSLAWDSLKQFYQATLNVATAPAATGVALCAAAGNYLPCGSRKGHLVNLKIVQGTADTGATQPTYQLNIAGSLVGPTIQGAAAGTIVDGGVWTTDVTITADQVPDVQATVLGTNKTSANLNVSAIFVLE